MKIDIVEPFTLNRSVGRFEYPLNSKDDYKSYEDKVFYFITMKRKIKVVEDNYRKIIVLFAGGGDEECYYIYKTQKNSEEEKKSRQANILCQKLVKSLDNGEYSNKALMESILTHGVSRLRNFPSYEFNLPPLTSYNNAHEDSALQSLDLNNAYAQVLYTHGLISFKMHQMLVNADKSVRLRVLGMLAKQQSMKVYEQGKDTEFQTSYKTKYYGLFQWAEARVAHDMVYLKHILTDKYFVFYWVDGIYYRKNTPKKIIAEVERYLNGMVLSKVNYEYKFEAVPYLRHYKEDGQYFLYLTKENRHGEPEPKLYSLSRAWLKEEAVEVL